MKPIRVTLIIEDTGARAEVGEHGFVHLVRAGFATAHVGGGSLFPYGFDKPQDGSKGIPLAVKEAAKKA